MNLYRAKLGITIAMVIVALLIRLPGLGDVMTVDEENWMLRSELYYDKFLSGDPGGTFMTTHPGATAMWLIGGGMTLQERRLGFEANNENLLHFRKSATLPMVLAATLLIGLITWLLATLIGPPAALAAGLLLACEPYLAGLSQIAHLDALQSLLMLAALLAFLVQVTSYDSRITRYATLAGILTGLAMGLKLILALWLLPTFLGILVVTYRASLAKNWPYLVRLAGFGIGVAALTFFLIWPALWVKDDIEPSLTRDVTTVVTEEHISFTEAEDSIAPASFYIRTVLGRVTPHVQILTLGALALAVVSIWFQVSSSGASSILNTKYLIRGRSAGLIIWLAIYSLGFLILITLAAKKGDRYAAPALAVFPVLAGLAAAASWPTIKRYLKQSYWRPALAAMAGLAVIAVPLLWHPHTLAYNNPLFPNIRPFSQQGWGEGLEAAAAWLNEHPLGSRLTVASWYPSVMQTYFHGRTFSLSSVDDLRVAYVVTYRNMRGRAPDTQASNILDRFNPREPVHTISINGVPYVWIYETLNVGHFLSHVGEIVAGVEVGQTIIPNTATWNKVAVGFATFSSRANTEDVIIHVRDNSNAAQDLRTMRVNAADLVDNEWHEFTFEPIADAAGHEFYVAVTSPTSFPGNAVTVRSIEEDVAPGRMVIRRRALAPGETNSAFMREGDLAIQIPKR